LRRAKEVPKGFYSDDWCIYGISLYWAIMTFTSIGYGDVTPQREIEYWVASLSMIGMAAVWAYIISQVVNLAQTMTGRNEKHNKSMDSLNRLMQDRALPDALRTQLRSYLLETKDMQRLQEQKAVIDQVSPMLQGEISMHLHKHWIDKVWYLRGMQRQIVVGIARKLSTMVYAPSEEIYSERTLFIVRRGMCIRKGRILFHGDIWGEDMLLTSEHLRDHVRVRAVRYLEILMLSFFDLDQVMQNFPEERGQMRWAQIRIATMKGFVKVARAIKDFLWQQNLDFDKLSEKQRLYVTKQILEGYSVKDFELGEEDAVERQIEKVLIEAEDELACGRIWSPQRLHAGMDSSGGSAKETSPRRSRPITDPPMSPSEIESIKSAIGLLAMKVDALLLKDRPHHRRSVMMPEHFQHHRARSGQELGSQSLSTTDDLRRFRRRYTEPQRPV